MNAELKAQLIAAHRAQDWGRAIELSAAREAEKRPDKPTCAVCGQRIQFRYPPKPPARLCRVHSVMERYGMAHWLTQAAAALMLLCSGCATTKPLPTIVDDLPPLPHAGEKMSRRSVARASDVPMPTEWPQLRAVWVPSVDSLWTRVYGGHLPDRSDWTALGETTASEFYLPRWEVGFFGVKAFDPVSGLESEWGTTQ